MIEKIEWILKIFWHQNKISNNSSKNSGFILYILAFKFISYTLSQRIDMKVLIEQQTYIIQLLMPLKVYNHQLNSIDE